MALTNAYVTTAQLKTWSGISDTGDDESLEFAINAASRAIDHYCGRRFHLDAEASARTYKAADPYSLFVDDIGSTTGLVVATDDNDDGTAETSWTITTDYVVEPTNALAQSRPVYKIEAVGSKTFPFTGRRHRVTVTAKWGWPAVPDAVLQACLILSARFFHRKGSPQGVAGFGEFGVVRLATTDPDVASLLNEYRAVVVA